MIQGIGASPGIAIGKAFVLPTWEWELPDGPLDVADLAYEMERLSEGIRTSKEELEKIKQDMTEVLGSQESTIFDAHIAILEDPIFLNEIHSLIQRGPHTAEAAVKIAVDKFVGMFDLLDDDYMKERALDVKDVGNRLLKALLGSEEETLPPKDQPYILVAKELTPSQFSRLEPTNMLGIVTVLGGTTSHVAIMARALNIPYVLGLESKLPGTLATGDPMILDGRKGIVIVHPSEAELNEYRERQKAEGALSERLASVAQMPAETADGIPLRIDANISSLKELEQALRYGASSVGLLRSEFLYMDRPNFPTEDEQYEVYRRAAALLGDRPLVIRTLDIGGDKQLDYFPLPEEENPSLGYRAIRIMLERTDLFKTQLRAILRANERGNIRILYPMIASLEDVRSANRLLDEAKRELAQAGVSHPMDVPVGMMIELPAAAMMADLFAKEVDFFSIGTNDLVQYVLAVDRMNDQIAHLYDPYHPAVLRLLKLTMDGAKAAGIPVSVCGELAGDPLALPLWLGLGVSAISMSTHSLLNVKHRLRELTAEGAPELVASLLAEGSSADIRKRLQDWAAARQAAGRSDETPAHVSIKSVEG
ncbi:phosphoenolpyruvate--protein phosphotransferase [Paenibacillus thermoaerophilus]|uniref:Phosphoenolpyruvate-protein phosphotransferase n=1 Tax=Paenibacillus thermoaerophilus TaxID=1215385 RepID=A0ABW2V544_9BACL|nr:phosphoenolpyruvate--protein phosphotransferase [Paenibacillus thermoaerophilus]TMV18743.1 phosphoenolpyruvate--protein phosphotransferase [Paenibacillus thermoaerophilus]